jgi:hypothetical protein
MPKMCLSKSFSDIFYIKNVISPNFAICLYFQKYYCGEYSEGLSKHVPGKEGGIPVLVSLALSAQREGTSLRKPWLALPARKF